MKSHRQRVQRRPVLEPLEGRLALSGMGGLHHQAAQVAEIHGGRHGADDPAGHNARDDKGGVKGLRHGADDPANHNAKDDKGGTAVGVHLHKGGKAEVVHRRRGGAEHPAGHK
jgi:hypothetical protein